MKEAASPTRHAKMSEASKERKRERNKLWTRKMDALIQADAALKKEAERVFLNECQRRSEGARARAGDRRCRLAQLRF